MPIMHCGMPNATSSGLQSANVRGGGTEKKDENSIEAVQISINKRKKRMTNSGIWNDGYKGPIETISRQLMNVYSPM